MITLRVSALPLLFECAAPAHVTPDVRINEAGDAATLGTAVHNILADLAVTGEIDWDAVPTVAQRFAVPEDDLRILVAQGRNLWDAVRESFPDALAEIALSAEIGDVLLTGHVDLISVSGTIARVGDWKTGRFDSNYAPQMQGYAALVLLDNPELTECTATILWIRDQEAESYTMTRADMPAWIADFERRVVRWDGVYRPGKACRFCPLSHECRAANAMLRRDVAALSGVDVAAELATMPPEQIVALAEQASRVAGMAYRVREAIRGLVKAGGDIRANGHRLTIQTEHKRELRPAEAWPVLEAAGFSDSEFAECMRLSMRKAEDIVGKRAGRGKGAAAKRALAAALEEAGAVETKTTEKLVVRRA